MIAKRWTGRGIPGLVVAGVLAGALAGAAGCSPPPAPRAAPGPTAASGPAPAPRPTAASGPAGRPPVRSAPSASPTPAEPCPEGGVRLVEGDGNAAMGLRVADFQLVNCGAQPYVLEGYPGLSLRDDRDDPVAVAVEHGSAGITTGTPDLDGAPRPVTLAPGQAASFGMVWRNLVTESAAPPVTARIVEVEPRPGAPRLWLRLAAPVDLGNTGKLGLGPWRPLLR
ncbi:DUF4232 domain-containing protein [Streptomyces venezuelae]|uniref:DUF4232 domain-containing protein n=1 Tax=Streptomyces venezuelae TaxID=54571 RepID=A0A5P2DHR7_STRVZ|nr:DUF4232 domain-containing protein [Streptomyces venezuelae]QES54695.1 DUF4232 domain-containing protein [Streptomyces venezuelae]